MIDCPGWFLMQNTRDAKIIKRLRPVDGRGLFSAHVGLVMAEPALPAELNNLLRRLLDNASRAYRRRLQEPEARRVLAALLDLSALDQTVPALKVLVDHLRRNHPRLSRADMKRYAQILCFAAQQLRDQPPIAPPVTVSLQVSVSGSMRASAATSPAPLLPPPPPPPAADQPPQPPPPAVGTTMVCNDIGLAWPLGTRVTTAVVKGNPFCPQGQLEFSIVSLNSSAPVLELVATDGYMNGARFPLQFYLSPYALGKVIRSRGRKASLE